MGVICRMLLIKFKAEIAPAAIQDIIKAFANLVNLIEPMKSFKWGEDVGGGNMQQGFTHVFECTFDNRDGLDVYGNHPAHIEFGTRMQPAVEKFIVIDYKPVITM